MLFDAGTPDTSVYMIAGYVIFFVITAIYLISLFVRTRNLRRDLETLETMEREEDAPAPVAPSAHNSSDRKAAQKS